MKVAGPRPERERRQHPGSAGLEEGQAGGCSEGFVSIIVVLPPGGGRPRRMEPKHSLQPPAGPSANAAAPEDAASDEARRLELERTWSTPPGFWAAWTST